jgi:hypothetical protein
MICFVCGSEACSKPQRCDKHAWVDTVLKELAGVNVKLARIKPGLDDLLYSEEDIFLAWKAAALLRKWRQ